MNDPESNGLEAFASDDVKRRYMAAYDALLEKWPVPYEGLQVPTRFGVTHVLVSGSEQAPPLVLLHAFCATAAVWRPNVEGLGRHFRVYAVDIVGQFGKSVSSRRFRTRRDFADWLSELFDALGIARASLVGNSYGAFLALNQASLAPERVDRVVMINPGGVFASFLPHVLRAMARGLLSALRPAARQTMPTIASILGRNVRLRPDEQEWANLVAMIWVKKMRINAIYPNVLAAAELRAIRTPALLLMGDNELLYDPHVIVKRARHRMPSLETQIIPGAHHIAAMAKPEDVNARIIRFLAPA